MKKPSLCWIAAIFLLVSGGAAAQDFQSQPDSSSSRRPASGGPNSAKIHTELASMYFQEGNVAVALEELGYALIAFPKYAPAYNLAGLVHAFLRENDKAEALFKKALELGPNDPEISNNYGWFLCQSGKEKQSIPYFLDAIKNPQYVSPDVAYTNAGRCSLKAGDVDGAETYLNNAIRISSGGNLSARLYLAHLRYGQGNFEETRRLVTAVLKDMPMPPAEALWLALRTERKLGNRQAENALATQLRGRHPDSPEYQNYLKGNFE